MTIDEVIQYFGSLHRACTELKIYPSNMTRWKKRGHISYLQQFRIAELTEGKLMPDPVDPRILERERKKASMGC